MLIKSIFLTTFITSINLFAGFSFYQIYLNNYVLSLENGIWLGVLLSNLPGALFFNYLVLARPFARTNPHLIAVSTIKLFGLTLVMLFNFMAVEFNLSSIIFSLTGFLGWLGYDYWYSKFPSRNKEVLQVGQQLPNFKLQDCQKQTFESKQLSGSSVIYLFYRGNWCPLCMAQIKEIAAQYQQLAKNGTQIVLVSPQPHANSLQLAEKFDLPFIFLVDQDNTVAKQLNILAKNGLPIGMQALGYDSDTVMPTVIITDNHNKILFADLTDNYRVRPEPETFIKVLQQADV